MSLQTVKIVIINSQCIILHIEAYSGTEIKIQTLNTLSQVDEHTNINYKEVLYLRYLLRHLGKLGIIRH